MTETAIFAAGCFWGVEAEFRRARRRDRHPRRLHRRSHRAPDLPPGLRQAHRPRRGRRGHASTRSASPTTSCSSASGPTHDPTTRNRQGADIGSQYRSAIFFSSPEQEAAATRSRDAEQAKLEANGGRGLLGRRRRVVTEITPAATFWPAEDYHQRYLEKRGQASCNVALRAG